MIEIERVSGIAALWIAPATVIGAIGVGLSVGLGPALLVLAGGTLLGAVTLLWSSLGRLTGESPLTLDEAIGLAAPSAEEERKRAVVRALKDLDYERSVGKISEEDYAELAARYRAEAKTLLRALEAGLLPLRKTAEVRLAERLRAEGISARSETDTPGSSEPASTPGSNETADDDDEGSEDASKPVEPERGSRSESAAHACPKCRTVNDTDASFCKRCGERLAAGAEK